MFAEEEWIDDPEANALNKKVISRTNASDSANITPKVVGKKKSLLRTLQTLGPVPIWSKGDSLPQGAGNDSETEALPTPRTKRKKKRSKRGRKTVAASGEAGQEEGSDVGVKNAAPEPVAKNKVQSMEPIKAGFKNTKSIPGSSKPDYKSIKDQQKHVVDSNIETLNRKQWRNKIKNKKKCKNKFKVPNEENALKTAKAETIVQKDIVSAPITSGVNAGKVVSQPQQPSNKKRKLPQKTDVKAQKRKIVSEGKEMTFTKTESNPGTETVKNNKNPLEKTTKRGNQVEAVPLGSSRSRHIEFKKVEDKPLQAVSEVLPLGPPDSKRRKQEQGKVHDRRRENLRRILNSHISERIEQPVEQEETHATEQLPADRSTALRSRMEHRLEAARFRYINEVLYTTSSGEAKRMFRQDPQAFGVYHKGFTAQVKRWPVNPVDAIISYICQKPASLVVADFGCGDCKIALSVKNQVHSFDLAPLNDRVTVCDMANVPLKNGTVDIAVFCLSLMGTNLVDFLLEANRVLVMGGILKIAEVASRFENVRDFMSALSSLGFKLITKDTDNSHFYSFEFEKVAEAPERVKKAGGLELRPCVYKKR